MTQMEPLTEREFMIEMNGNIRQLTSQMDSNIKQLASEIKHLTTAIGVLDQNRMVPVEKRLSIIERWQNNFDGGWKVVIILGTLLTIASLILGIVRK